MYKFAAALLVLVSLTTVWTKTFETAKPVKECTDDELKSRPAEKLKHRTHLDNLVVSPPCEAEYCVAKKSTVFEVTVLFTPLHDGKTLHVKAYELGVASTAAGLAGPILQADVYFHKQDICDVAKYNVTCPFKAKIPIYGHRKAQAGTEVATFPKPPEFRALVILEDDAQNVLLCYTVKIKNEWES